MRLSRRIVPLIVVPVVLTAGCSMGKSEFDGNLPDVQPTQSDVFRTPSPVGTDLPYTDPPVIQTNPGPTGGLQGDAPTTAPPASPGEASDGGGAPAN